MLLHGALGLANVPLTIRTVLQEIWRPPNQQYERTPDNDIINDVKKREDSTYKISK